MRIQSVAKYRLSANSKKEEISQDKFLTVLVCSIASLRFKRSR